MLLSRVETKPADLFEHFTEHIPGHHHFSKLEHNPPGMKYQTPTYLDEPRLNACQRPSLDRFWQSKFSEKVVQIIGQACPELAEGINSDSLT